MLPFVSIIIPTYNDALRLATCIEALVDQTYPAEQYEIIVIDNGSNDNTRQVVERYPARFLTEETIQSSYAARNKGISHARGDIIAFTDSDCIPAKNWIELGVKALQQEPSTGLVAGKITLFYKNQQHPTPVEMYEGVTAFRQQVYVDQYKFGATANVFTYKQVIERVGPFNHTLISGGDREWGGRVHQAGYRLLYAPDVVVAHPARHAFREIGAKAERVVVGLEDLAVRKHHWSVRMLKALVLEARLAVKSIYRAMTDKRLQRLEHKGKVVAVIMYVSLVRAKARLSVQLKRSYKPG